MKRWHRSILNGDLVSKQFRVIFPAAVEGGIIAVTTSSSNIYVVPFERGSGNTWYLINPTQFVSFTDRAGTVSKETAMQYAELIRDAVQECLHADVEFVGVN